MYRVRTPGYSKKDQVARWALPERVFFACGACHILAHAFLERYGAHPVTWVRARPGLPGNHVFVEGGAWEGGSWVFDFHGYADRARFLAHLDRRNRHLWPGWEGDLVPLPADVLVSEARSREIPSLRLREPGQFLHDALPRARRYLDRFGPPPGFLDNKATNPYPPRST